MTKLSETEMFRTCSTSILTFSLFYDVCTCILSCYLTVDYILLLYNLSIFSPPSGEFQANRIDGKIRRETSRRRVSRAH